jgi:hypothetical protein
MARIAEAGVRPLTILTTAAALWLYSRWNESKLPSDIRLSFGLGNAVLNMAPHEKRARYVEGKLQYHSKRPGKVSRRAIGERLRSHLTPLFLSAAVAIEAELDRKQRALMALHTPFPTEGAAPQAQLAPLPKDEKPSET